MDKARNAHAQCRFRGEIAKAAGVVQDREPVSALVPPHHTGIIIIIGEAIDCDGVTAGLQRQSDVLPKVLLTVAAPGVVKTVDTCPGGIVDGEYGVKVGPTSGDCQCCRLVKVEDVAVISSGEPPLEEPGVRRVTSE